jgi:hypothetical protein
MGNRIGIGIGLRIDWAVIAVTRKKRKLNSNFCFLRHEMPVQVRIDRGSEHGSNAHSIAKGKMSERGQEDRTEGQPEDTLHTVRL